MTEREQHLRGLAITVTGILVLTPDSLLIRLIQTDPWTLLFWRGLLTGIVLGAASFAIYGRQTAARYRALKGPGIWAAVCFSGSTLFFVNSIRLTAVANTLVIISAAPLFAAILAHYMLGERTRPRTWIAIVVAMGAIGLVVSGDGDLAAEAPNSLAGNLAAVACALCMAGSLVALRKTRSESATPVVALSGLLVAIAVIVPSAPLSVSGRDVWLLLVLGAVVIPLAFALTLTGPKYLPAPEVGLIFLLETVLGPFWVWLVLDEMPPRLAFVGGALLIATLAAHSLIGLKRRRPAP